MLIFVAVVQND